ncbi:MAG TPA: glycosyltransferase family 4 protein [Candidatus Saccharimonadales bacterium]|nr:glycosyltransferase family 4 protein [Candidatus Saccharimonadales bacterium]
METLKIGFVFDDSLDKTDGVQQYVLALGSWLAGQGHEVHYLVGETRRKDLPRVHSLSRNISVRFNGNRLSMPLPASKKAIQSLITQEAFDILHVQVPYSPFMAGKVLSKATPTTAVIGTFHILPNSKLATTANRLLALWLQASLRRFDEFVSVSTAAATFAQRIYGINSKVLPNVVDYDVFHNTTALPQYSDDTPTILFLGRLVPRKGCQTLLEAVDILVNQRGMNDLRVLVGGKGPLMASLNQYVAEHKLKTNVNFLGYIDETDKPKLYASADISVFPSSGGESFGIVLLEAMASGRAAVLAGNNPGYASVLVDKPELLFEAANAEALAEKLETLLKDKVLREKQAAWGAAYVRNFDTARVGLQLEDVYKQALRSRRNVQ